MQPIAVFDSGLGGLSVVRHLRKLLPQEDILYFGDTARVPYGSKSRQTVITFALEDARFLMQFEPKLVVVACNTASALAIEELESDLPVPVVGCVVPGALAAVAAAGEGPIAILGTEGTIGSGAYPAAIAKFDAHREVLQKACPLFVPLVEEGRGSDDDIVRLTARTYLEPLRARGVKCVVLGCTHYPLLRDAIAAFMGPEVSLIDSGRETSLEVRRVLAEHDGLFPVGRIGSMHCYVSDNPARFKAVGSRFLEQEITHVEFVEPERYISSGLLERG